MTMMATFDVWEFGGADRSTSIDTKHTQVEVSFEDQSAFVDEGIAPLILELWKAECDTVLSCQENRPGVVWVCFSTAADAERFLDIVARYEEDVDSLYNRIAHQWARDEEPHEGPPPDDWKYTAVLNDFAISDGNELPDGSIEQSHAGRCCFSFGISVRFPASDMPVILQRLREFNAAGLTREEADHDN